MCTDTVSKRQLVDNARCGGGGWVIGIFKQKRDCKIRSKWANDLSTIKTVKIRLVHNSGHSTVLIKFIRPNSIVSIESINYFLSR